MVQELLRGLRFTVVTIVLFGIGYHVALWGVGRVFFPGKAAGSLIAREDGTLLGSSLIAQAFARDEYVHPRSSAVDYNAASTGGSNFGPSNPDHLQAVRDRLRSIVEGEGVSPGDVPSEMVTTSGAGLDPHIPVRAAEIQARRVARARGVPIERVEELIRTHTEPPTFGFLGRERVNVLELNLALDEWTGNR